MNINIKLTESQVEKLEDIKDLGVFIHQAINKKIEEIEARKLLTNKSLNLENEKWKDIKGHEGQHEVSSCGRVRSVDRTISKVDGRYDKQVTFYKQGRIKTLTYHHGQYFIIKLSNEGKNKTHFVHRLVAEAFLPNPNNLPIVNHKNSIKTDNNIENLEWVSNSENVKHAIKNKLTTICSGENHGACKYTDEDILKIRKLYKDKLSLTEIGKIMGTNKARIWEIVHRKTWKHI